MKKFVLLLLALFLAFALTACCCINMSKTDSDYSSNNIESTHTIIAPSFEEIKSEEDSASETESTPSEAEPVVQVVDYSALCGYYSDVVNENGPCYSITINKIDNNTKTIEFEICYVGFNCSPIYDTGAIYATIASDNTVKFSWTDSWANKGTGTLILNPNNTSSIKIKVNVTEEADVNRATLSTYGDYETLTRR